MLRFALALGLALSAQSAGACGLDSDSACQREQSGAEYRLDVPTEKFITDCDAGVNCTHMQSGQHYSVQTPLARDG
jgi:hypothetical protein